MANLFNLLRWRDSTFDGGSSYSTIEFGLAALNGVRVTGRTLNLLSMVNLFCLPELVRLIDMKSTSLECDSYLQII